MARRAFRVVDVVEILVHWHAGRAWESCTRRCRWTQDGAQVQGPAIAAGLAPAGPPFGRAVDSAGG